MKDTGDVALIAEMRQTAGIIRNFDFTKTVGIADEILAKGGVFISGEGSSRILPAKHFMAEAFRRGFDGVVATGGSYEACEYDLSNLVVLVASNSGQTKETITLVRKLLAEGHEDVYAVTVTPGSVLDREASASIVLSCGPERAVAATKSVVEQALVYQSILCNMTQCVTCEANKVKAAVLAESVMAADCDDALVARLARAERIFFAGRNNGVAEELALKATEITRKPGMFLEGTIALHGFEETMTDRDAVIFIEPFETEHDKTREIFEQNVGAQVVAIASKPTPFPTLEVPLLEGFSNYFALMAGWNLLVHVGQRLGIDLDKPNRARKIGNAI